MKGESDVPGQSAEGLCFGGASTLNGKAGADALGSILVLA